MTRLSEALERAQMVSAQEAAVAPAERASERTTVEDIPSAWHLDSQDAEVPVTLRTRGEATEQSSAPKAADYRFADSALKKVVVGPNAESAVVEQYRRLAAILHHAQRDHGDRSVMVASA